MNVRTLGLVLGSFLLTSSARASFPRGQNPLLLPGKSIGPLRIGMSISDAKATMMAFGSVRDAPAEEGRGFCNPSGGGVCVFDVAHYLTDSGEATDVRSPGLVMAISTDDTTFRTVSGLGVGSSVREFVDVLGTPTMALPPKTVLTSKFRDTGVLFVDWPSAGMALVARLAPPFPRPGQRIGLRYLCTLQVLDVSVAKPKNSERLQDLGMIDGGILVFDVVETSAPTGWLHGNDCDGEATVRPVDSEGFSLNLAMDKLPPRRKQEAWLPAPTPFLRNLVESLLQRDTTIQAESLMVRALDRNRAIASYDYLTRKSGRLFRHRTWHLALVGRADTLFLITATASEVIPAETVPFTTRYLAAAEGMLLRARVREP
jgi:hypothetical protein